MSKSSSRASRTMERLRQVAEIGRVDGLQGTTRPGLGRREQRACELVAVWMAEAGLDVGWDAHGNLFGGLAGTRPGAGEVWSGSHLDTVPDGGTFDGALGVLCGLEAVVANGRRAATQRVVVFRDEEGWRFGRGCFGSRAVCGRLADGELEARDADGVSVAEALAALAIDPGGSPAALPASYVEVHVEQGPELERQGFALGEVTAIAGMAGFAIEFTGQPGHAGTVPMTGRRDALAAAAEFVLLMRAATVRASRNGYRARGRRRLNGRRSAHCRAGRERDSGSRQPHARPAGAGRGGTLVTRRRCPDDRRVRGRGSRLRGGG
jgi:allantoate deiminase